MKIARQNRDESIDPYYLQQMEEMVRKSNGAKGSGSDSSLTPADSRTCFLKDYSVKELIFYFMYDIINI